MMGIILANLATPTLLWFVVGVVFFLLELATPGLVLLFFGIGAWVVAVVCLFVPLHVNLQLLLFMGASVLSLALFRRWVRGVFSGYVKSRQDTTQELQELIGKHAVVKEKITPKLAGRVELHGSDWTAQADQEIAAGTPVEVIGQTSIILKVKPL
jgi:membrane protein implicated in regulation of membrane protease activity